MTPVEIVEDFLAAVEQGRVEDASRHLDPSVRMIFPGGREYRNLTELGAVSSTRYRSVGKHRDHYDTVDDVVYSWGRLYGENLHGVRYDHVRYVDRFVLRDGLIVEQLVWNDLAETGVLNARTADDLDPRWRP